jgi:general stress protein CsbA
MISLLLGIVGVVALYQPPFWANTIMVVSLVAGLFSIVYMEYRIPSGVSGGKKSPSI